jgi:HTH-type transcriptional regulator/antitoxin HigA
LEREADRFAARMLIPQRFEGRLSTMQVNEVSSFAKRLGIAPAIVIGRLQHEKVIPFNQGNHLRRLLQFAED